MVGLRKGPAAYLELDVYQLTGTGSDIALDREEAVIEGMTKEVTGMREGDRVLITFDLTLHNHAEAGTPGYVDFRIKVDDVIIGPVGRFQWTADDANRDRIVSMERYYLVPAAGDYTFTVTWYYNGTTYNSESEDGRRTMIVKHFH